MRPTQRPLAAAAATLMASLFLTACGSGSGDGDREVSMTVATPTWNPGIASLAVSQEMGYFDEEGLDMEIVLTDSATTQFTQIATGKAATGAVSPEPLIIGHQDDKDIDLSLYMSYYAKNIYGLQVPEESPIQSIDDLEGTTVGAISLSSVSVTQLKVALQEAGVPEDSVDFVAIGTGSQQASAVERGQVDALALLDTSFQVLANQGIALREVEVPGAADLTAGGLAAPTGDLEDDRDLHIKIGRAVAKGVVFAEANPEAAVRLLYSAHPEAKPQGLGEEQAVESGVKVLQARLANLGIEEESTEYGRFDEAALQANVDFLETSGEISRSVPVEDFYDDSLLEEINDFDFDAVREEARNGNG
ncbi:ABC transporter substrate-binding protein [Aeromicrobium sp. CTD01-1L150]|uniref:ABC transporter substrate-binding protein n=1 Tax=Aeromicrobium sp. CTD01-1L150 TaxID=3341830 RepID=UPI0035BEC8A5